MERAIKQNKSSTQTNLIALNEKEKIQLEKTQSTFCHKNQFVLFQTKSADQIDDTLKISMAHKDNFGVNADW